MEDLPLSSIYKLCKKLYSSKFERGKIIFNKGDQSDKFYIIIQGIVNLWDVEEDGNLSVKTIQEKGRGFGEMSILRNTLRSLTA